MMRPGRLAVRVEPPLAHGLLAGAGTPGAPALALSNGVLLPFLGCGCPPGRQGSYPFRRGFSDQPRLASRVQLRNMPGRRCSGPGVLNHEQVDSVLLVGSVVVVEESVEVSPGPGSAGGRK